MDAHPNRRILLIALVLLALDQATKLLVAHWLRPLQEWVVIDGFFKIVYWINTGAAWSLFPDRNGFLAVVSVLALVGLVVWRRHFYIHSAWGQFSLGLIFGGILGNLVDRLCWRHVVDMLRFYIVRANGQVLGFPAFNLADSGICVGVAILIIISWNKEPGDANARPASNTASAP